MFLCPRYMNNVLSNIRAYIQKYLSKDYTVLLMRFIQYLYCFPTGSKCQVNLGNA